MRNFNKEINKNKQVKEIKLGKSQELTDPTLFTDSIKT